MNTLEITTKTPLTYEQMLADALSSPALKWQSDRKGRAAYPANVLYKVSGLNLAKLFMRGCKLK